MGFFRFRKSIKLLPGLKINFSKTGISTSVGQPGATVNIGRGKVKTTVGLPGTGLSYQEQTSMHRRRPSAQAEVIAITDPVAAAADTTESVVDFMTPKGIGVSVMQHGDIITVEVEGLPDDPLPRLLDIGQNDAGAYYLSLDTGHKVYCEATTAAQVCELFNRANANRSDAMAEFWQGLERATFGAKIVMLMIFPIIGLIWLAQRLFFRRS